MGSHFRDRVLFIFWCVCRPFSASIFFSKPRVNGFSLFFSCAPCGRFLASFSLSRAQTRCVDFFFNRVSRRFLACFFFWTVYTVSFFFLKCLKKAIPASTINTWLGNDKNWCPDYTARIRVRHGRSMALIVPTVGRWHLLDGWKY